jgi:hypothetical protein
LRDTGEHGGRSLYIGNREPQHKNTLRLQPRVSNGIVLDLVHLVMHRAIDLHAQPGGGTVEIENI